MKLEDIKKKNIYSVPDKYFDQLPTRIQARVNDKKPVFGWSLNWNLFFKVATPAFAVLIMLVYFNINSNAEYTAEELLAQVETEDLIAYLDYTDITVDEIIEELDLSAIELNFDDEGPILEDMELDEQDLDILYDEYGIESEIL